jgi:putative colanic acid biosynthesis UDP-glucose lipid carrier transferase
LIKWIIMTGDFFLLNGILLGLSQWHWRMGVWERGMIEIFILVNNIALMLSQLRFSTIVHFRLVGGGDILKRIVGLTVMQSVLAYLLTLVFAYSLPIGWIQYEVGTLFVILLLLKRLTERWFIKLYREAGRNTRYVTLVGSDPELVGIFRKLKNDETLGYHMLGYYGDEHLQKLVDEIDEMEKNKKREPVRLKRLGSSEELLDAIKNGEELNLGDELYYCVSRIERNNIRDVSKYCDQHVVRFFYVPVSVETIGLNLKREMLDDMEVFTTYENPLQNSVNKAVKRMFDIVMSLVFLVPTALIFPFIWIIIKIQSPGPIFFKQKRTGLDGREFDCLKFRSMHVNADADKVQATKDDPRKYPFGNFMRKANIDELPQFWNVLRGDMSIVGPRPHMLAHTEQYSQLIDKYMVRHFVKPGVTGWAQVTGYRGETKELWQMEGRVKRDIWYMEHWSIWLDIRIIWMTFKTIFVHDKNAY